MNAYEYPTKYKRQADVLTQLWFAFTDAHNQADWALAAKLGKRYYRAKRWAQSHGFKAINS